MAQIAQIKNLYLLSASSVRFVVTSVTIQSKPHCTLSATPDMTICSEVHKGYGRTVSFSYTGTIDDKTRAQQGYLTAIL